MFVSSIKIISYERIDKSDSIDFNRSEKSRECLICHYYYFSYGFKYQSYVCNSCHDFSMSVQNLCNLFIVTVQNIDYRVYVTNVDKKAAIYLLNNSILSDKGVI